MAMQLSVLFFDWVFELCAGQRFPETRSKNSMRDRDSGLLSPGDFNFRLVQSLV